MGNGTVIAPGSQSLGGFHGCLHARIDVQYLWSSPIAPWKSLGRTPGRTIVTSGVLRGEFPGAASAVKWREDRQSHLQGEQKWVGLDHAGESPAHQVEPIGCLSERFKNHGVRTLEGIGRACLSAAAWAF